MVGNIEPGVPGVDGGQWCVVGRAYTPNHRYISSGGVGIDTSLHLCFTFISVYAILCELCSACMEIKIKKTPEETAKS